MDPERQRSLFSWAEFMSEATERSEGQRRHEAPTLPLFEWALTRETEEVIGGAGP